MEFNREKFRKKREELRWSITALAKASNTCRQSISTWENGKKTPSEKKIRLLANIMGVKVSEISSLTDEHPQSETNILASVKHEKILEQSFNKDSILTEINQINHSLTKINRKFSELSIFAESLLKYSNSHIYVKDQNLNYIIANKAFLQSLNLTENYCINGKTDIELYSEKEAKLNTQQDRQVLSSGKPLLDYEQNILGTRRKKWGIYSKIPIFDSNGKISGILNIVVDITERKKQEKHKDILEYAINKFNYNIWIAKGFNDKPGEYLFREYIFTSAPYMDKIQLEKFWGDKSPNDFTAEEHRKIWGNSADGSFKTQIEQIKREKSFPVELHYKVTSPFTGIKVSVKANIIYDKKMDVYIGKLSFVE